MSLALEQVINQAFSKEDAGKVERFLDKLLPYLDPQNTSVVGGFAIRYHLTIAGKDLSLRSFNDLDLIARSTKAVDAKIQEGFLVYHYHPLAEGSSYLALVDPDTRIKIDIFPYDPAPDKVDFVDFKGKPVALVSPEDQLIKTVLDTLKVKSGLVVDPKQFKDAEMLFEIVDKVKAAEWWRVRGYSQYPQDLQEAFYLAKQISRENPQLLKENPFKRPQPYNCSECRSDNMFKLTPMEQVYRVLGYVE